MRPGAAEPPRLIGTGTPRRARHPLVVRAKRKWEPPGSRRARRKRAPASPQPPVPHAQQAMDVARQELLEDYVEYMEEVKKFVNALYQRSTATASLVPLSEVEYGGFIEVFMSRSFHTTYLQPAGSSVGYLEKLAWCGDRVLGLITTNYLIKKYPSADIGFIDRAYHRRVNNAFLNILVTQHLGLKDLVIVQKERPKLGADMFEALMYKMFQFHGFETTQAWMLDAVMPIMDAYVEHKELRTDDARSWRVRWATSRRTSYAGLDAIFGRFPSNGSNFQAISDSSDEGRLPRTRTARPKRRRFGEFGNVSRGAEPPEVIEIPDDSSDGGSDVRERDDLGMAECSGDDRGVMPASAGGMANGGGTLPRPAEEGGAESLPPVHGGNVLVGCRGRTLVTQPDHGPPVNLPAANVDSLLPRVLRRRHVLEALGPPVRTECVSTMDIADTTGRGVEALLTRGGGPAERPQVRPTTPPLYSNGDAAGRLPSSSATVYKGNLGHPDRRWPLPHRPEIPKRSQVLGQSLTQDGNAAIATRSASQYYGNIGGQPERANMPHPHQAVDALYANRLPVLLPSQEGVAGVHGIRAARPCELDSADQPDCGGIAGRTDVISVELSPGRPAEGASADRPIELDDEEPERRSVLAPAEHRPAELESASLRHRNPSPSRRRSPAWPRHQRQPCAGATCPPPSRIPPPPLPFQPLAAQAPPPLQQLAAQPPPLRDYNTELLELMGAAGPGARFETAEETLAGGIRRHRCQVSVPGVGNITAVDIRKEVAEQTAAKNMMEKIKEWATQQI